jgi:hypothetical protein
LEPEWLIVLGPPVPGHLDELFASFQDAHHAGTHDVTSPSWEDREHEQIEWLFAHDEGKFATILDALLTDAFGAPVHIFRHVVGRAYIRNLWLVTITVRLSDVGAIGNSVSWPPPPAIGTTVTNGLALLMEREWVMGMPIHAIRTDELEASDPEFRE